VSYRRILEFYLRVAAVSLAGEPRAQFAQAAFRNENKSLSEVQKGYQLKFGTDFLADRERHARLLNRLAGLFLAHRGQGLPFHADTSLEFAKKRAEGADPGTLDNLLEEAWYGKFRQPGLVEKAREAAYYADEQALRSERFRAVAVAVRDALEDWLEGGSGP
jgi:hypothetical protein